MRLNTDFVRSQFPSLSGEWTYFDNAGGSQSVQQLGSRINEYLYNTNVQLGASYDVSRMAGERVFEAQKTWSEMINANSTSEIVFGPSSTLLLQNLSRSMIQNFEPGDEVIVTNCDHEANIGPWMSMQQEGVRIKSWNLNADSYELELDDLKNLMTDRTKLVAFTHASNILGTINPVKEITRFVHDRGALVCVDGVAYAPHRLLDVYDLDVDFYVFSFYKVYGPHYSLLYGKKEHLEHLPGINHYFIGKDEIPYKLQPGNVNFELNYGTLGVVDYLCEVAKKHGFDTGSRCTVQGARVFDLMAEHEGMILEPFMDFLQSKSNVDIVGASTADPDIRVPTVSFVVDGIKSSAIPIQVDKHKIGIRYGDFYARRLIEDLGFAEKDGVIRVSMVHYNTLEEVEALIRVLDSII